MKTFVGAIAKHLPPPMVATFQAKTDAIVALCDSSYSIDQAVNAAQSAFCRKAGWAPPDRLHFGYIVSGLRILGEPRDGLPRTHFAGDKREFYYRTAGGLMFSVAEKLGTATARVWHPDGGFPRESSLRESLSEAGFALQGTPVA